MIFFEKLRKRLYDINALNKAVGLMSWDRQILMPPGGASARTEHCARLSRMAHELLTSEETRRWAEEAGKEAAPDSDEAALVRVVRRDLDIQTKLPTSLVERKSRASSDAYETWRAARATSNFAKLAPYLEELFDIARETAELRGYRDHVYDPLIDLFEEGATTNRAAEMFETIKGPTRELVELANERPADDSFLIGAWDVEKLRAFGEQMARKIGFDFNRGRLDVTTNAFCANFSCDDVRMTARSGAHIGGILFSTLHEMGHGLYEQASPRKWDRTPLSSGVSNGVHESQSRTWENIVGRSREFWSHFLPSLQHSFPSLTGRSLEEFYRGVNRVKPGPIRIGSDELTYNLHILVRFELECEIVSGALKVKDIPESWNEKYRSYLGIVPKNDGEGCLQDVHWSRGSIGYFPTYSMGNMMSWQIWHRLAQDLPGCEKSMGSGDFSGVLAWLTENVYSQAKRHTPTELMIRVTGRAMEASDFVAGMRKKFGDLAG